MADPPTERTDSGARALLEQLLATDADLEYAFDQLAKSSPAGSNAPLQAVVPGEALDPEGQELADLLASITAEYDDIDRLIGGLSESERGNGMTDGESAEDALDGSSSSIEDAVAFVSAQELADPTALERAVAPLASEQVRLESLFARARHGLDRLHVYRLSSCSPEHLIALMRQEKNLRTIQSLVEFLRALTLAADTFESLDLPQPHIRDYLRHLYTMGDWGEMRRLVRLLEATVSGFAWAGHPSPPDRDTASET